MAKTKVKGIREAAFVPQSSDSATSLAAIQSLNKSLTPQQCYEMVIAVRSAIQAISTNIAKAELRYFSRRTGDEIESAELDNFFSNPNTQQSKYALIADMASWFNIAGEIVLLIMTDEKGKPIGVQPLNPFRLSVGYTSGSPTPTNLSEVKQWIYSWENGILGYYNPQLIGFAKNFNPYSQVRGLSPLITGVNEASSSYFATRYNKSYFENDCVPSHILVLPKGTPKAQRDDIERRYLEQYQTYDNNAHKVMVVAGDDITIQNLNQAPKDGQFLEMQKHNTGQIAQLYKVPAATLGIYDKARFETASIERKIFLEDTLLPQMNLISELLQVQIVDRYFPFLSTNKRKKAKLSKMMEKQLKAAISSRPQSDVIVILDPDTLPIMAEVKKDYIAAVKSMSNDLQMSVNEAAEFMGLDLPYSVVRDRIYVPNNVTLVAENPDTPVTPATAPVTEPMPEDEPAQPIEAVEVETTDEDETEKAITKDQVSHVRKFIADFRKLALTAHEKGRMFRLSEVDALISEYSLSKEMKMIVRADFIAIKEARNSEDPVRAIKDFFNSKNRSWIKHYLGHLNETN